MCINYILYVRLLSYKYILYIHLKQREIILSLKWLQLIVISLILLSIIIVLYIYIYFAIILLIYFTHRKLLCRENPGKDTRTKTVTSNWKAVRASHPRYLESKVASEHPYFATTPSRQHSSAFDQSIVRRNWPLSDWIIGTQGEIFMAKMVSGHYCYLRMWGPPIEAPRHHRNRRWETRENGHTLENVERGHFVPFILAWCQIGPSVRRPLTSAGGWIIGLNCAHGNRQAGQISGRETFRDSTT